MAVLSVQKSLIGGQDLSYTPLTVSDSFVNTGKEVLYVKNSSPAPINITVVSVANCNHGYNHSLIVAVSAGVEKMIGPFIPNRFNDVTDKVTFSSSDITNVSAVVIIHS